MKPSPSIVDAMIDPEQTKMLRHSNTVLVARTRPTLLGHVVRAFAIAFITLLLVSVVAGIAFFAAYVIGGLIV